MRILTTMPYLAKLLGIVTVSRTLSQFAALRKAFSEVGIIVSLMVVMSMVMGGIVVAVLYAGYIYMLNQGATAQMALMSIIGIALGLIIILGGITMNRMNKLRVMPERLIREDAPLTDRVSSIADAFIDGFLQDPARKS